MATSAPDFSGFTYSGDGNISPANGGTDQSVLSGLGDLFSGIGVAVGTDIQAANAPSTRPIATTGGTLVYNPRTGQYVSASGLTAQSSMSPLILLLALGVVVYLVMRK